MLLSGTFFICGEQVYFTFQQVDLPPSHSLSSLPPSLSRFLSLFVCRVFIYILWQITKGRKLLIVLLKQQIVNVSYVTADIF